MKINFLNIRVESKIWFQKYILTHILLKCRSPIEHHDAETW